MSSFSMVRGILKTTWLRDPIARAANFLPACGFSIFDWPSTLEKPENLINSAPATEDQVCSKYQRLEASHANHSSANAPFLAPSSVA
jgi:hypothetical protein